MKIFIFLFSLFSILFSTEIFADTYSYDALGRIVKIIYDNGSVVCYKYDKAGNRISTATGSACN